MILFSLSLVAIFLGPILAILGRWIPELIAHEEMEFIAQATNPSALPVPGPQLWKFFLRHRWLGLDSILLAVGSVGLVWVVAIVYGVNLKGLALFVFCTTLLLLATVDLRCQLLPDALTKPLLWLGLLIQLHPVTQTVALESSVLGAVFGYLSLLLVSIAYTYVRKKDGLGYGDVKLMAAVGAWIGPVGVMLSIFMGSLLAIIWQLTAALRDRDKMSQPFPFGPWLAAGSLTILLLEIY